MNLDANVSITKWWANALPLLVLMLITTIGAGKPPALQFFKDLAETRSYTLGRPVKPAPTPDGSAVIFLRGGACDPVMRLFQLDTKTGKVDEILTPDQILRGSQEKLSMEERARRERMRQSLRGFTSFELSEDG